MHGSIPAHGPDQHLDGSQQSLSQLIDHIVGQHHAYLRRELPDLNRLAQACDATGPCAAGSIGDLRGILSTLTQELLQHMHKEEMVLFPWIRQLEASSGAEAFHCGSLAAPINVMEHEHRFANDALSRLRWLTNDFVADGQSSAGYRALVAGLAALEADLHEHIHEENDILFPRALELESALMSSA